MTLWLDLSLSREANLLPYEGRIDRYLAHSVRLRPRPFVAFDEFYKKPPTDDEVQAFFEEPSEMNVAPVQALWSCHDNKRQGKLVYLHLYRSAGFSIRAILRAYAHVCRVGTAFVSHCVDVGVASMEGDQYWTNDGMSSPRAGKECWLSHLENREGSEYPVNRSNAVSTRLLQENQVDIIGDHLPVGALKNWKDSNGNVSDVRYLAFFRDPLERLVSHHMFRQRERKPPPPAAVVTNELFTMASTQLQAGKYWDKTSNHFMSPDQKRWIDEERVEWTYERRVNLTKKNLVEFGVVVGLVENFSESLQLLEHLVDATGNLTGMFRFFSSPAKIDGLGGGSMANSRKFTASVASAIRSNATQCAVLEEYLKYEQSMYNFAAQIHRIQYSQLPSGALALAS